MTITAVFLLLDTACIALVPFADKTLLFGSEATAYRYVGGQ